ncbi:hypothetical protein F4778DRAFT_353356 [Xylariomycetidae sp. FL2044]|nr:hypothetical protein F4778DRAFT_353356 [Xylariomycetidae sp. FL2044]
MQARLVLSLLSYLARPQPYCSSACFPAPLATWCPALSSVPRSLAPCLSFSCLCRQSWFALSYRRQGETEFEAIQALAVQRILRTNESAGVLISQLPQFHWPPQQSS